MAKRLRPSDLRDRVTIQHATVSQDDYGHEAEVWSDGGTVWASVHPMKAEEARRAGQTDARQPHQVRLRYLAGVTDSLSVGDRLLYRGRALEIVSAVNVEGRNEEWELICSLNADGGA